MKAAAAQTSIRRALVGAALLVVLPLCAGCASVALSASADQVLSVQLDPEAATTIAINALEAWNEDDYAGWSRDWSPALKAGVRPADFEAFRGRYFGRYGPCFAISHSESSPSPRTGYTRWAYDVECRSGRLRFIFAFSGESTQVQSVYVEPGP